jgi:cobalt/nickel transport system permease protein
MPLLGAHGASRGQWTNGLAISVIAVVVAVAARVVGS